MEEHPVLGKVLPGGLDLGGEVIQVLGGAQVVDLPLQTPPQVLYGVAVWRVSDPIENRDIGGGESGLDALGHVAGRPILHEDGAPCLPQAGLQVPLQYLAIHRRVHLGVLLDKIESPELGIAKRRPNHEFGRMFGAPHDEVGMVAGDGG